jgi:hypothetical protein
MQTKLLINGEFISGEGRDEVILDQHPFRYNQRNAPRGHEAIGLWQRHVHVWAGGLHNHTTCDGQTRLKIEKILEVIENGNTT